MTAHLSSQEAGSAQKGRMRGTTAAHRDHSVMLPTTLLGLAMLIVLGSQCRQLVLERDQLQEAVSRQATLVQNATALRARLDQVARETQLLADKGNVNARRVVEDLRKRGITINPGAASIERSGGASASVSAPAK